MHNDAEIMRNVAEELRWTPELDEKDIAVKGKPVVADIKQQIGAAFKRSAQIDSDSVCVEINGPEVTLSGKVKSWAEHEAAADIAWSAPGVTQVKNHICVGP